MIIPSIDLIQNKAVQLRQGKEKVLERDNPLQLAEEFNRWGEMAVIDLDEACGNGSNEKMIGKICQIGDCRVGGGIRSVQKAEKMVSLGARKIIIGTSAFQEEGINTRFLKDLVGAVGKDKIIVAVDAREGEIVTRGWSHPTGIKVLDILPDLTPYATELLFTCVEKEGMMKGTDVNLITKIRQATSMNLTVAGGISSIREIEKLARLNVHMQLGMAVYSGAISLADAFIAVLDWDKMPLIPAITISPFSQVLMQAYVSRESLKKTFETRKVCYYSRSRKELWTKGETSGHCQEFLKVRTDCDADTVLITADQKGAACHTGEYSCFGPESYSLETLYSAIRKQIQKSPKGSEIAGLTSVGVREKIQAEANELIKASKRENIIPKAADLIYYFTMLLAKNGIKPHQLMTELRCRQINGRVDEKN